MIEDETGLFWAISQSLREARASGDSVEIDICLAELDDMRVVTRSEALRSRCEGILAPGEKTNAAKQ